MVRRVNVNRVKRMEQRREFLGPSRPSSIALLDDGRRIAFLQGQAVPWPSDAPLPAGCKFYGFDPRIGV